MDKVWAGAADEPGESHESSGICEPATGQAPDPNSALCEFRCQRRAGGVAERDDVELYAVWRERQDLLDDDSLRAGGP